MNLAPTARSWWTTTKTRRTCWSYCYSTWAPKSASPYDGETALKAFADHRPSVAFLDIGMPGTDGYELARRLREQFADAGTMIVGLSGWGQEEDRRRGREAGFDHHLVKPAEIEALRALLAECVHGVSVARTRS